MKRVNAILVTILIVAIMGCGGGVKHTETQSNDVITIDVTETYPMKELVLQDIMDVEYIALETTDEFIHQGNVMAVGKNLILVINNTDYGDIFVYDRSGKALRKIDRRGQGSEEYTRISEIILDEENNEIFVSSSKKIIVYDLYGNFKRSFYFKESTYVNLLNYDKDNLIHDYNVYFADEGRTAEVFYIISKQDGSLVKELKIPFKKDKPLIVYKNDNTMSIFRLFSIIPSIDNFFIMSFSSDTVFTCFPDNNMTPFIVRTPSIQSMDPEVYLIPSIITDQYYFMMCVKKDVGFPNRLIMYDTQEKTIYQINVLNDDYTDRKEILYTKKRNKEIALCHKMEAFELIEANKQGKLKGKLKEIADGLGEDDNPVIMLVKYK